MSLIAIRPRRWNEVVGQSRVLRVLHAALTHQHYTTRGFIFDGMKGVGKTSVAYLFARALMCVGNDPLGCGQCASCRTFDEAMNGHYTHPDMTEVDAAAVSGVKEARDLLQNSLQPATVGQRRIVLIDEAHRLSDQAWDAYLKPLEEADKNVMFLYVSSEARKIPATIASRCAKLHFARLHEDDLLGVVMTIADREGIPYTLDGLRRIARLAKGSARDAVNYLSICAMTGKITTEDIEVLINLDTTDICARIFKAIVSDQLKEAVQVAEAAAMTLGPSQLVEALFSFYAQQVFQQTGLIACFGSLKEMSTFFIKWNSTPYIPADALLLMLSELSEMRVGSQVPQRASASSMISANSLISETTDLQTEMKPIPKRPLTYTEARKRYGAK